MFKSDCVSLGLSYATVFKEKQEITCKAGSGVTITREQLRQVDLARMRLQGIWDNIVADYKAEQLGRPITDRTHSRMLYRGLAYMELVEPLEAANYVRLQAVNSRVASQGSYVLPAAGAALTQTETADSLFEGAGFRSRSGARPSRFKWLEDQKTLHSFIHVTPVDPAADQRATVEGHSGTGKLWYPMLSLESNSSARLADGKVPELAAGVDWALAGPATSVHTPRKLWRRSRGYRAGDAAGSGGNTKHGAIITRASNLQCWQAHDATCQAIPLLSVL